MLLNFDDFLRLRRELPVADVRSEGEYQQGHIPEAVNIPILNNAERVVVGTTYKQVGQLAAIKEAFRLVGPRMVDIVTSAETLAWGHELIVHCWRGGMRSGNFCQFAGMMRIKTHQLAGGYKTYRRAAIESFGRDLPFIVLSGNTGSGKSEILRGLRNQGEQIIDLETLASHKGSVFGGLQMPPQPTTEQFQNALYESILALDSSRRIWVEDESLAIGRVYLPDAFWMTMSKSPVVEINMDRQSRVQRLMAEYGTVDRGEFIAAMEKISKRLGGQHLIAARSHVLAGDIAAAIEILLTYYDKAYANGLRDKQNRIKLQMHLESPHVEAVIRELVRSNPT
jgi:tRNA 2-selenouridine synthase